MAVTADGPGWRGSLKWNGLSMSDGSAVRECTLTGVWVVGYEGDDWRWIASHIFADELEARQFVTGKGWNDDVRFVNFGEEINA